MIVRLMYVLPMILGRTYDMKKASVGVDIFPVDTIEHPRVNEESFYRSSYKMVESSTDVKEVLEISGDLSLGIKAGQFQFRGIGSYIRDTTNAENSVDILTKVSFRTVSKSLPLSAKPAPLWFNMGKAYLGTHFVRSILYGGDLIACVRFKAVKSEYLQDIRATIKSSFSMGSALDLVGDGKLETLDKKLEKKATMEINYYATVPLVGVPNTIKGLRALIKNFEQHVQSENDGIGVPVEVELEELSSLSEGVSYLKNTELETELGFFEEYLDDLLSAKSRLKAWISTLPENLSKEQEKQISDYSEELSNVLGKFTETISNLNLESDSKQLDDAKAAYKGKRGLAMTGKFNRELRKLQKKIILPKDNNEDRGSLVYIHYGASECIKESQTTTLVSGYLASSPQNYTGAGHNYLCLPKVTDKNKNEELKDGTSKVAGVKYGLLKIKPNRIRQDNTVLKGVTCSVCLVKQRPNLFTFLGQTQCPEDEGWTIQYSGFVMASTDVNRSENVCVDSKYGYHEHYQGIFDQSLNFAVLRQQEEIIFIPCAVCSK